MPEHVVEGKLGITAFSGGKDYSDALQCLHGLLDIILEQARLSFSNALTFTMIQFIGAITNRTLMS